MRKAWEKIMLTVMVNGVLKPMPGKKAHTIVWELNGALVSPTTFFRYCWNGKSRSDHLNCLLSGVELKTALSLWEHYMLPLTREDLDLTRGALETRMKRIREAMFPGFTLKSHPVLTVPVDNGDLSAGSGYLLSPKFKRVVVLDVAIGQGLGTAGFPWGVFEVPPESVAATDDDGQPPLKGETDANARP